jgi:NitT/TauT family transport system substrate-binding protein
MRALARLLAAAALIAGGTAAQAQTKLTIAYGAASAWAPALVAKDKGFFAKHGIDADLQFANSTALQPTSLVANSIQVGSLTPTTLLLADEGGLDLQIVAGAAEQTKDNPFGAVIAREGSGIETPADFRGKKVGVPGLNAVLHIAFMKWLKTKGVDPKDVNFVEITLVQTADLFRGKQIDAAVAVEPFIGLVEKNKLGHVVSPFPRDLANPSYIDAFWAMRREFIEANPKVVEGFRAAIKEATDLVAKDPTEARKVLASHMKLPEAVARTVKLPTFTAVVTPAQLQFWIDTCKELGVTKGTSKISDLLAK